MGSPMRWKTGLYYLLILLIIGGCVFRRDRHQAGTLLPEDERFWDVIPRAAVVERIGIAFGHTRGPVWHSDGFLIFSDTPGNAIYRWTGRKYHVFLKPSNHSAGLLAEDDGSLVVCEQGSASLTRISPSGERYVLADSYRGSALNGPSDLCRSSAGEIYFTDPRRGDRPWSSSREEGVPFSGIYRWKEGELNLLDSTLSGPGGIALSPDERKLYVANLEPIRVNGREQYQLFWLQYSLDESGQVEERSLFYSAPEPCGPDAPGGLVVDRRGFVYLATPQGILVVDPEGGHLGTVEIPLPVTSLGFGKREKNIYITAGTTIFRLDI